ncbi:hypothetical protein BH20PSE1_BH20PSE1_14730 [soil metagenome]
MHDVGGRMRFAVGAPSGGILAGVDISETGNQRFHAGLVTGHDIVPRIARESALRGFHRQEIRGVQQRAGCGLR